MGLPFNAVVGANIYYLAFSTVDEQARLLDLTSEFGFNTLRIWAFHDHAGIPRADEVCFQFRRPGGHVNEIREGPFGLERLDRVLMLASERGIRLILTLSNFHPDYGGFAQYQRWLGLPSLAEFYTRSEARAAFRAWIQAIVMRENTLTGVRYADEPAILAWEVANEPRFPGRPPDTATLTNWLSEMSAFIRSLDSHHAIGAGDEGFFHNKNRRGWLYDGSTGVSADHILAIPTLDFGTFHLYPDLWGRARNAASFGERWIREHAAASRAAGKPMLLEEFGLSDSRERDAVYRCWLDVVAEEQNMGTLVWMLGLPGKGDRYLLECVNHAPALRDYAGRVNRAFTSV